jgi:septal ring factor EnvC (AmiA/AmiB activator)
VCKKKICIILYIISFLFGFASAGVGVYFYSKNAMAELTKLNQQSEINIRQANKRITELQNTNRQLEENNIELRKSSDDISKAIDRSITYNQELNNGYNELQKLIGEINNSE